MMKTQATLQNTTQRKFIWTSKARFRNPGSLFTSTLQFTKRIGRSRTATPVRTWLLAIDSPLLKMGDEIIWIRSIAWWEIWIVLERGQTAFCLTRQTRKLISLPSMWSTWILKSKKIRSIRPIGRIVLAFPLIRVSFTQTRRLNLKSTSKTLRSDFGN